MFQNALFRLFGPKRDEVTGCWRKLNSEELHDLYSVLMMIKLKVRWVRLVARKER
jgi:hypothetical protein